MNTDTMCTVLLLVVKDRVMSFLQYTGSCYTTQCTVYEDLSLAVTELNLLI